MSTGGVSGRREPTESGRGQHIQADWASTLREPHGFVWYTAVLISLCGICSVGTGHIYFVFLGLGLMAIGGTILALLSLATEFRLAYVSAGESSGRLGIIFSSAVVFIVAVTVSSSPVPLAASLTERLVILTIGVQALLLTVDTRPRGASRKSRAALLLASHGTTLAGAGVALGMGPTDSKAALLLYVVGFSFMTLHAFWSRQRRPGVTPPVPNSRERYWESLLLTAIICGVLSAVGIALTSSLTRLLLNSVIGRLGIICLGTAGVVALACLSVPESPPKMLARLAGAKITIVQHVLTLIVLINTLLLSAFVLRPSSFVWVLAGLTLLLGLNITVHYLGLAYSFWRDDEVSTAACETPITVVISAFDEAKILPETLAHNLEALPDAEFLLVPAASSSDGTRAIMAEARDAHPDRVRIVEGTTGSKAGDLNAAWPAIETPFVMLLDADETVSAEAVAKACQTLETTPEAGIVQGRKAASYPSVTRLSRYVTVERQHSTWIDHPFLANGFEASHFAGSAALLRQEVVPAVGGFDADVLTEDIDLAARLYLETDWEICYEPGIPVREMNPKTLRSLVRQRERWARGWAQVAVRHGTDIIREGPKLGLRRTMGLSWKLLTAVSSPLYTIFPVLLVYWAVGPATPPSFVTSLPLALYIGLERGVSFGIATVRDPVIDRSVSPRQGLEALLFAYGWLLFGWVIQLHALYLQLAGATETWDVTEKHLPGHAD